jgi:hypothetical protein
MNKGKKSAGMFRKEVLPLFQIICHFKFSRYISFIMYVNINIHLDAYIVNDKQGGNRLERLEKNYSICFKLFAILTCFRYISFIMYVDINIHLDA